MSSANLKRNLAVAVYALAALLLFVVIWYGVCRVQSHRSPLTLHAPPEPVQQSIVIKVAAFNIAHGRGGKYGEKNWKHKTKADLVAHLDRIAGQIEDEDPDLILLNEVDFSSAWSFNVDQARYIGDRCGFPYVLEQKNMDVAFPFYRFCFGNALLSKYPLTNARVIEFSPYSKWEDLFMGNHDGLYCELILPSATVGIFGIHLEYRSEDVRVKAAEVVAAMSARLDIPVLALGDFNATPTHLPLSTVTADGRNAMDYLFNEAGFISYLNADATGFSFPSEKPDRLIDWIIGRRIQSFSNSRIIQTDLSDHLMIVSEVAL